MKVSSCPGLHCRGCGDGGGPVIGLIIALVIVALIASKARAIGHAATEAIHVLVLVAIAGVSVAVAAVAVGVVLVIHRKLGRIERATDRMHVTLTTPTYAQLPEPPAALPAARADIPAAVYIHPARERDEVGR